MKSALYYVGVFIVVSLMLSIPNGYSYLHHRNFSPLMQRERRRAFGSHRYPLCKSGTRPGSSCEPGPNSPYCHYYNVDQFGARSTCVCDRELHKYKCWLILHCIDNVNSLLIVIATNKGHYPTVTRQLLEFLYIRKEHVEHNFFVKYYVQMANFNKVIKV